MPDPRVPHAWNRGGTNANPHIPGPEHPRDQGSLDVRDIMAVDDQACEDGCRNQGLARSARGTDVWIHTQCSADDGAGLEGDEGLSWAEAQE